MTDDCRHRRCSPSPVPTRTISPCEATGICDVPPWPMVSRHDSTCQATELAPDMERSPFGPSGLSLPYCSRIFAPHARVKATLPLPGNFGLGLVVHQPHQGVFLVGEHPTAMAISRERGINFLRLRDLPRCTIVLIPFPYYTRVRH